ncbi:MAG: hypothetical protein HY860_05235 [Chlamydiales bacterium]|nr:hypothetical protein [Chlamydiales bacterium]
MGRHFIKKFFIIKLMLIALILVVLSIYTIFFIYSSPKLLSKSLTNLVGSSVTIKDIIYKKGEFSIKNISMDNLPHYTLKKAVHATSITFKTPYYEYLLPNIIIDEVIIDDLDISIEFSNQTNTVGNWTEIIKNVDKALYKTNTSKTKHIHGRVIVVKKITLNNTKILLKQYERDPIVLEPIPHLTLTNIDSEKGIPMDKITHIIIKQVIKTLSDQAGIADMLISVITLPARLIQLVFDPFSIFFGVEDSFSSSPTDHE